MHVSTPPSVVRAIAGKRFPHLQKTIYQLAGNVLRVSSRTAVAKDEQLAISSERAGNHFSRTAYVISMLREKSTLCFQAFGDDRRNSVGHYVVWQGVRSRSISRHFLRFFDLCARRRRGFPVSLCVPIQQWLQHLARVRTTHRRHFFRRAAGDDAAAVRAAFRSEIDDVIGALDDVEVVLDHDHGVAKADQSLQHVQQFVHVGEMQPGRRLIQNVNRPSGCAF